MSMEKYGVSPQVQHKALRDKEAQLMQKAASAMQDPDMFSMIQAELQDIRDQLTQLDGAQASELEE